MLTQADQVVIDHLYLGPGHGCVRVLRCEALGVVRPLPCGPGAIGDAIPELDDLVFERFRRGELVLQPAARHARGWALIQLADDALIAQVYHPQLAQRDIVRRELVARGLFDRGLFAIGEYAPVARAQAIELMLAEASRRRALR